MRSFLNQKPWHPSNFKNQARAYEAEQDAISLAKRNALAKVRVPCRLRGNHLPQMQNLQCTKKSPCIAERI